MAQRNEAVTLNDIAQACGVSRATVSRALRNSSLISSAVTRRIQKTARQLGYRPDPEASRLMEHLKRSQTVRFKSTIAFLNAYQPATRINDDPYMRRWLAGVRERADQLGYALDEAGLGAEGMTPERLSGILDARGIRGLLIPPEPDPLFQVELDWSKLAVVASTTTASLLHLHRVLPDNLANMILLLGEVLKRGYQRPALISWPDLEERQRYAPTSVYSRYAWCEKRFKSIPVLKWDWRAHDREQRLLNWIRKHEPDCVLAPDPHIYDVMLQQGFAIPSAVGFISYAGTREDVSRLDELPEAIGCAAVDLLSAQINQGEFGLPRRRKTVLLEGRFIAGSTTRGRDE